MEVQRQNGHALVPGHQGFLDLQISASQTRLEVDIHGRKTEEGRKRFLPGPAQGLLGQENPPQTVVVGWPDRVCHRPEALQLSGALVQGVDEGSELTNYLGPEELLLWGVGQVGGEVLAPVTQPIPAEKGPVLGKRLRWWFRRLPWRQEQVCSCEPQCEAF